MTFMLRNQAYTCILACIFLFIGCFHFMHRLDTFPELLTAKNENKLSVNNSLTTSYESYLANRRDTINDMNETNETSKWHLKQSMQASQRFTISHNRSEFFHNKSLESNSSQNEELGQLSTPYHGKIGVKPSGESLWIPRPLKGALSEADMIKAHENFCFNSLISQSISLNRDHPDYRHSSCRNSNYNLKKLPKASIVIIFHNEEYSVLLRSIHSILNRTPPDVLKELILVDDFSDVAKFPSLSNDLDNYLKYTPKTFLIRLKERHGLMKARMEGIQAASSPIVVLLDSHVEVGQTWLEPLLKAISNNTKLIALPIIEYIDPHTFNIEKNGIGILGFSWTLGHSYLDREEPQFENYDSPIMAGGIFAASKQWFQTLGQYDSELKLYGGEEFEMSFKTWMCGGKLQLIPCSRVAHVFRTGQYFKNQVYPVPNQVIRRNKLRVANVWMDEYAVLPNIFFQADKLLLGSLDNQKSIRKRLGCKSFEWYLNTVYPELMKPELESSLYGPILYNTTEICFDTLSQANPKETVKSYPCHYNGGPQLFFKDGKTSLIYPFEHLYNLCIEVFEESLDPTAFPKKFERDVVLRYTNDCKSSIKKLLYDDRAQRLIINLNPGAPPSCLTSATNSSRVKLIGCSEVMPKDLTFQAKPLSSVSLY